jgi:hypothetical protein
MIETPAMHDALRTHNLLELLEDLTIVVAREIMQKPQRTPAEDEWINTYIQSPTDAEVTLRRLTAFLDEGPTNKMFEGMDGIEANRLIEKAVHYRITNEA